jgi:hypothetical protein
MKDQSKSLADERRAFLRHDICRSGRLLFVDQPCFVECTIRNISNGGALLSIPVPVRVPPRVLLWEQGTGRIQECVVRWRNGRMLGVHFTDVSSRAVRRAALARLPSPLGPAPWLH